MSHRDPAHLDNLPPTGNSPDNPFRSDDGDCEHCDGTGDDPDVLEGRGYHVDCEHCGGSGCKQDPEIEPDPDMMPGGVDDL